MIPVIFKLDKERTLKLTFAAIARCETLIGINYIKWDLKDLSFVHVARILCEALRHEMPDITPEKMMDLIDEYSNNTDAFLKTYECIGASTTKNAETGTAETTSPTTAETTSPTATETTTTETKTT